MYYDPATGQNYTIDPTTGQNVYIPLTETTPDDETPPAEEEDPGSTWHQLLATYTWLNEIPGAQEYIMGMIINGATTEEIVYGVRQQSWYMERFPGQDPARWMDESTYLDREAAFRNLLRQYGAPGHDYNDPNEFVGFFQMGWLPSDLENRFQLYEQLRSSGQPVIDAYYVYAGLDITVDDLFLAMVDPDRQRQLIDTYRERAALTTLDFQTYINRMSDVAMRRMVDLAGELADAGLIGQDVFTQLQATDMDQIRLLVGQLYAEWASGNQTVAAAFSMALENEGDASLPGIDEATQTISVITQAMRYAMIGSAAAEFGFALPSRERLDELLSAGVDRARAIQSYSQIAVQGREWMSFARRANISGVDQRAMEDALMRGTATPLSAAMAAEKALGERQGAAGFQLSRSGRLEQPGLGITYR